MTEADGQWPAHCRAFVVEETASGFVGTVRQHPLPVADTGDVLVRVAYSGLNYKDALVVRGARGIARAYPQVPGIDLAGTVVASRGSADWVGARVLVTGFGLGVDRPGGWAEYAVVPETWLTRIPDALTPQESMIFGTAGLTAALCCEALFAGGVQRNDAVLVTGASGGVGSHAVAILAAQGLAVTAASRKGAVAYLKNLGATTICHPDTLRTAPDKALARPRWRGAVDSVGGAALADILKQMVDDGVVALCGMAGGTAFAASVFPFILRGVHLAGIDSVRVPQTRRALLWQKLAGPWRPGCLAQMARVVAFPDLPATIDAMLAGAQTGRVVVVPEGGVC